MYFVKCNLSYKNFDIRLRREMGIHVKISFRLKFLAMLQNLVLPVLKGWPNFHELVFIQDKAPPHYLTQVFAFFNV